METRLENMGYEVGFRLVERTCQRRWMAGEQLEAIKFVCKDLWSEVRVKRANGGVSSSYSRKCLADPFSIVVLPREGRDVPSSMVFS